MIAALKSIIINMACVWGLEKAWPRVTSGQKFKIVVFIIMSVWIPVKSGKTRETVDQFHANVRT